MKVQVSKTMVAFINKMAKAGELHIDHAEVKTFSERQYELNVGDTMDAEYYGDEDFDDDGNLVYKAIVVFYPDSYYAAPKYITTAELTKEAKWRKVTTEEGLSEMLKDLINI